MDKNSFKLAAKLYGQSVFASVLSIIIYISVTMLTYMAADDEGIIPGWATTTGNVIALLLQGTLLCSFVYTDLWRQGDKDANAVHFGRIAYDKWKGLKVGLVASIPSFLTYVVLVAEKLFGFWQPYAGLYRIFHLTFYPIIVWAFGSNVTVGTAGIGWGGIALALIPVLVTPIVAVIGYGLGYRQIIVSEKLIYKDKKKKRHY